MARTALVQGTGEERAGALCRLICNYRLLALTVAVVWLPSHEADFAQMLAALTAAAAWSFAPIPLWNRVGAFILKHPTYVFLDLLLGLAILAWMGPGSPFFYFTLGTALLSGVLYSWTGAMFFSTLLVAGYWSMMWFRPATVDAQPFQVLVNLPALYPLAALAGAAVRGLLDRQAITEEALREAQLRGAVDQERTRIAREMHDSLTKTIQGVALSATALPTWVERDPGRAQKEARSLAQAAQVASTEARELLGGIRADALEVPLASSLTHFVDRWSEATGIAALCDAEPTDAPPDVRWEVFSIAREALDNVDRHADAQKVAVRLAERDHEVVLEVADDGRGFPEASDTEDLHANGHFGVIGMFERAQRIGGRLEVESTPGEGTTVRAVVPVAPTTGKPRHGGEGS